MRTPNRHNTTSHRQGFTLTELLTVVAIIVLLIGTVTVAVGAATRKAQRTKTQFLLGSIASGLGQFQTDFGYLPPVLMNRVGVGGTRQFARDVTTVSQVPSLQQWFSYTTLADYLIGYGGRNEDGYGVVTGPTAGTGLGQRENPPFGIRAPGTDGAWGSIDTPLFSQPQMSGAFASRNPMRDPVTGQPPWNARQMTGRVYGPYLELTDEKLLGGLKGFDAQGNPIIVTNDQLDPDFDKYPKVLLDYWGTPISYYRAPYAGSDLRSELSNGSDGFVNLSDVFALRPWEFATGQELRGVADANGDEFTAASLKGAAFALFSRGPDRLFDRNARRDAQEFNKDNIVETGR